MEIFEISIRDFSRVELRFPPLEVEVKVSIDERLPHEEFAIIDLARPLDRLIPGTLGAVEGEDSLLMEGRRLFLLQEGFEHFMRGMVLGGEIGPEARILSGGRGKVE